MTFKKNLCSIAVIFLIANSVLGQTGDESGIRELLKIPIPPSPNASSLGKFGDIPVGLSTGIPSISVPFFNWTDKLKELNVSVGLSYHAGGHKVEDMPSNCGLGWALNAGGLISRTVRGIPDDGVGGYLNTPVFPLIFTNSFDHLQFPPGSSSVGIHDGNHPYYDTVRAITEKQIDGEFDIFNISAENMSAKFFIDKSGNVVFFNQTNLSLTYERYSGGTHPILKFTLVDERAITYIFDVPEVSEALNLDVVPGSQTMSNISSFYLSKIISADKRDTIQFNYAAGSDLLYESGFSETHRISFNTLTGSSSISPLVYTYNLITTTAPKRISSIKFPDSTSISFTYSYARADYYGDYALTSVAISNETTSRKFDLSYDYFATASDPYIGTVYSSNDYTKRLKLTKVQEISGSDSLPPYIFQYNSQNLPPRNSRMQDHWGYYNGVGNTLSPSKIPRIPAGDDPELLGANRAAGANYCGASILEKIIYPTGGYTKFTYHINNSRTPLYNIDTKEDSVILDENAIGNFASLPFSNRTNDTVRFTVRLYNNLPLPEFDPYDEGCPVTITIKSTDNAVTETINFTYSTSETSTFALPANKTYQVKYQTECSYWLEDYAISIRYLYAVIPTDKNVGGLRVEKVEDNDSIGNSIVTSYEYLRTDSSSSGEIQYLPNYSYYKSSTFNEGVGMVPIDYWLYHWNMTSSPTQTLSYFRGSPIIYKRVKVKKSSPTGNLGYSVHEFTGFDWAGLPDEGYPFLPKQDLEWKQGLPLRDSIFNSSNQLIKRNENEWEYFLFARDSAKARNMTTGLILDDRDLTPSRYVYGARVYEMYFGRSEMKKSTEVLYSGNDSIKAITDYIYDSNHFLLTKQRTSNSKGDSLETRLFYPFNYTIATDNAIATVISKESWKKKSSTWYLTDARINEYGDFNSSFVKPKKIIAAEMSSPLNEGTIGAFDPGDLTRHSSFKDQAEFLKYDNSGRYTEVKSINGPVTSLIWSVTRDYPVAQASNANESNIAYSSFETLSKGNWAYSGSPSIHPNALTGSKVYGLSVGNITKSGLTSSIVYVVTYWKRDSAGTVTINGTGGSSVITKNGWILYSHEITGTTSLTISGTACIDEVRLCPKGALMTTYTYRPLAGISSQNDASNRITYYDYDKFGRLKTIKDQDGKILKQIDYKYQVNNQQ